MDWQLGLFRFGLLVCVVGLVFIATKFDIVESEVSVWNHNPTTAEVAAENASVGERKTACLSTAKRMNEYPSHCYLDSPTFRGLARDKAVQNIQGFLITGLALLAAMFSIVFFGLRMARENRA